MERPEKNKKAIQRCNCCSSDSWQYRFTENDLKLCICDNCGLYYVNPMPTMESRMTEMHHGYFAGNRRKTLNGDSFIDFEKDRHDLFMKIFQSAKRFAPEGKWLDIGCGTGYFMKIALENNIDINGIELTDERRRISQEQTKVPIYDQPIESIDLGDNTFAMISLINVFSHLTDPLKTFSRIYDLLKKDGIFVLYTSEIMRNAKKKHNFEWSLGDHLFFLGDSTIDCYCNKTGFSIIYREKKWAPEIDFSKNNLKSKGRSRLRNGIKAILVNTPGLLPVVKQVLFNTVYANNPVYNSILILKK